MSSNAEEAASAIIAGGFARRAPIFHRDISGLRVSSAAMRLQYIPRESRVPLARHETSSYLSIVEDKVTGRNSVSTKARHFPRNINDADTAELFQPYGQSLYNFKSTDNHQRVAKEESFHQTRASSNTPQSTRSSRESFALEQFTHSHSGGVPAAFPQ